MHGTATKVNQWLHDRCPGVKLNDDGVTSIQRDGDTVVLFEVLKDSEICHLCTPILPLQQEAIEPSLYAALEMNRFGRPLGGAWLAWDPDIHMLTLCHNLDITKTDSTEFNNTLDNFIVAVDKAREKLIKTSELTNQNFVALNWI